MTVMLYLSTPVCLVCMCVFMSFIGELECSETGGEEAEETHKTKGHIY